MWTPGLYANCFAGMYTILFPTPESLPLPGMISHCPTSKLELRDHLQMCIATF